MNDGYINLFGAIIKQAINDLNLPETTKENKKNRRSAIAFLKEGGGLDDYCAALGLNAEYIRKYIAKNGTK